MARLDDQVKSFIVREIAVFRTPTEVALRVKVEFGLDVDRRQIHQYNPTAVQKAPVGKKWRALFHATRERFLDEVTEIPIAHRAYRLRKLDDMFRRAEERGNYVLAAALLEQAAKEMGGAYTNRRGAIGLGGRLVGYSDVSNMTDEQLDAELAALLGTATAANK